LLIPSNIIKTDSLLFKANYQNPQFIEWFNKSWYAQGDYAAKLVPANGYVAPPLDGIWSTAPIFTMDLYQIEAVLNSKIRPTIWSRNFKTQNTIMKNWVGNMKKENPMVKNITIPIYLAMEIMDIILAINSPMPKRKALTEYLKTL
jgi:hypothetical protein